MLKYPHLFEPIRLGKTVFRNRMFASPISGRALDTLNRPDNDCVAFYEQKAMGGAASVCIGDCVVDSVNGLFGEPMVHLDDPGTHRPLNLLSTAISRQGAVASVELQHAGIYAAASRQKGNRVYGPCGGVGMDGSCEVYPGTRCVWLQAYERAAAEGHAQDLRRLQRPIDQRKWDQSSWVNFWLGRDEGLWTDERAIASQPDLLHDH